jgi:DNA-directed RNA polymerase subunit RPC12/RpoP
MPQYYVALQRCPHCHSPRTTVALVTRPKTHKEREASVVHEWTCSDCGKKFLPSDVPLKDPLLPCDRCKDIKPHKFLRYEQRTAKPLVELVVAPEVAMVPPDPTSLAHRIVSHIWECECGQTRVYGCHVGSA